jgi:hypothetical protein
MRIFAFDPAELSEQYARDGYIHIKQGIDPEFLQVLRDFADREFDAHKVEGRAIAGRKQQALYEFPDEIEFPGELFDVIATLCGLRRPTMTLSERHIKAYDADAPPDPKPHKDRYASQASIGLSIVVPEGSHLVVYPKDETELNPYNVSAAYLESLPAERRPEQALKDAREVIIEDQPGDVMVFHGSRMWHMRRKPAGAVNLYLKLNDFNCDPLGEDPRTPQLREETLSAVSAANGAVDGLVPVLSRRLDTVSREYTREWEEVIQARLWEQPPVMLNEHELRLLEAVDGQRTLAEAAQAGADGLGADAARGALVRLAERGVLDLVRA